jgi:Flp pilus assembly protein TadG
MLASFFAQHIRRWRGDVSAAAAVEFVLIAPAALMLMALVVFAGEGLEILRKVTMTTRTLTDLVTQQCDIGPNNPGYPGTACPSSTYTYSQIVGAASLVMVPYSASAMNYAVAEIETNGSTSGSGIQIWCEATASAASLCPAGSASANASASFQTNLATSPYVIFGQVQYSYSPLGIWFPSTALTLTSSIYLLPRIASTVNCSGC